jgi:hypothetical protein
MTDSIQSLKDRTEAYLDASADGAITPEIEQAGRDAYDVDLTMWDACVDAEFQPPEWDKLSESRKKEWCERGQLPLAEQYMRDLLAENAWLQFQLNAGAKALDSIHRTCGALGNEYEKVKQIQKNGL